MRRRDVFAVLVQADHVNMVVGPMFKLALSEVRAMLLSSTHTKYSPHNRIRRIRRQHRVAILDNID